MPYLDAPLCFLNLVVIEFRKYQALDLNIVNSVYSQLLNKRGGRNKCGDWVNGKNTSNKLK